jgi:flagellar biosynthesis GTPase FlhF
MSSATQPRVYRGANLEELLPRIREELGDDAVITKQREGIVGGIGGFFGRRCVEVEACAAEWLGLDEQAPSMPAGLVSQAYEQPDEDALMAEVVANPVIRRLIEQSTPFAERLQEALGDIPLEQEDQVEPVNLAEPAELTEPAELEPAALEPLPEDVTPAPELALEQKAELEPAPARRPRVPVPASVLSSPDVGEAALAERAAEALAEAGLPDAVARAAVEEVARHVRPFAPHDAFTTQLRRVLSRRISVMHGFGGNRRTIALAGPSGAGRTLAAARIARAYARAGDFEVAVLDLTSPAGSATLRELLDGSGILLRSAGTPADAARATAELVGRGRILVVDTPPVLGAGPRTAPRPAELLAAVGPDEVHLVLPTAMEDGLAAFVLDAVGADSSRDRLLLTRLDESQRVGRVIGLAIERRIPVSYVSDGPHLERGLRPADPVNLASMLLR